MPLTLAFPTPIGHHDNLDNAICEKAAIEVLKIVEDPNEDNISHGRLGDCTGDDLHTREEFQDVVSMIKPYIESFVDEVLGIEPSDLKMTAMWSNTHNSGSMHPPHKHPNSFLSAVLYVQTDPNAESSGDIYFSSPSPGQEAWLPDFKRESCISNEVLFFKPEVGKLIVFPSWLPHGVYEYLTNTDMQRISIAFNWILNRSNRKTASINRY